MSFRLPTELYDRLVERAEAKHTTVGRFIQDLATRYLTKDDDK